MSGRKRTRQPKWEAVTFAEIERIRLELGLPKRGMASALGVTNSTYHNWNRGNAIPTANRQQQLVRDLSRLTRGKASSSSKPSSPEAVRATAEVVGRYLSTRKLQPSELVTLTRDVLAVFGGAA